MTETIYETDDLQQLRHYLSEQPDPGKLRAYLFAELLRYCRYRNATEWNRAVRVCECLAIVGWGEHEPLEAIRGTYFNGNPNTFFINRNGEPRFLDAVWSNRKEGTAIDFGRSSFHGSPDAPSLKDAGTGGAAGRGEARKLNSQRNWIAKNPIRITRGLANCYENSKAVIESMEKELVPALDLKMRPETYGSAVNRILIDCSFSFYDNEHCKTNYIIADDSLKLKQREYYPTLLGMFTEKEIEDNGYYLRNRFTYGPFRSDTGTARIGIVLEKEFSELPPHEQKQVLSGYFIHTVGQCAKRLRKKTDYDFEQMIADFRAILEAWCEG